MLGIQSEWSCRRMVAKSPQCRGRRAPDPALVQIAGGLQILRCQRFAVALLRLHLRRLDSEALRRFARLDAQDVGLVNNTCIT